MIWFVFLDDVAKLKIPSEITLVCRIDVLGKMNVQLEKFLVNIKRAGRNRRAGGNFLENQ